MASKNTKTQAEEPRGPRDFNEELLAFLKASPTPFHATRSLEAILTRRGYRFLRESEPWKVAAGDKCFVTRNDSSLIAFKVGAGPIVEQGFRITGAHTDSPCLRLKPQPEIESCGLMKLGVEIYGSPLLSTWFDRDLSLAGRVSFLTANKSVKSALVDFGRPIAVVPNLAIHLNREVNENRSINKQTEMPPIVSHWDDRATVRALLLEQLHRGGEKEAEEVVDFELSFYDMQPASIVGLNGEFVTGARLDNLLSCFTGLKAFLEAGDAATSVLVCNDHEEIGSASTSGAQGTFLRSVLERLSGVGEPFFRAIDASVFVSTDNAHGIHPNYPERHDSKHAPWINQGPAIKINANQRYATSSDTAALFALCCREADVPFQRFIARADMGCGSTIGPITATAIGVKTVDIGVPTFAMHSVRETAGARDAHALFLALSQFYRMPRLFG